MHIDKELIEEIKIYALKKRRSVSDITSELYKKALSDRERKQKEIETPIARKYKGIVDGQSVDVDMDRLSRLRKKHVR